MRKPISANGLKLYVKSMGKIFQVYEICDTTEAANDYCRKHDDAAVIAEDPQGRIYIAKKYASACKSDAIQD